MSSDDTPDFVIECKSCEMSEATDDLDTASEFASKHKEHTNHEVEWTQADFGIGVDINTFTAWRITCENCDEEWEFKGETEAREFYDEHTEFTDHEPTHITQSQTEEREIKNLKQLIRVLERKGDFEHGAPEEAIYVHASDLGISKTEVSQELEKLKQKGEVYEPSTGCLRTT